ncbi:MAG TPA: protease SohB [Candidatus Kapabacteria bacterium]|nr:protease SohB [Candidatus Kapabacteria bacterium]
MVEFFTEYGLFLAKAVTVVVAILLIITAIAAAAQSRAHHGHKGEIRVTPLNDFFEDLKLALQHNIFTKEEMKAEEKRLKKEEKQKEKERKKHPEQPDRKRIFVLDFDGDMKASGVENLANEITAVLTLARKEDEVVLRLESPGGQVHAYGLAASQLERVRQKGVPLTVCVDMVAASGGYMMACVADKIIAAPFAILGSIGVVAELPNFNRALKKFDVDYDIYTAGQFKRTVTMLGENTEAGKQKFIEEIEDTHGLFKAMVSRNRPKLDMNRIATGEHWYGNQCLENGLIDVLQTSDDYLYEASANADIFEVCYEIKRPLADRLGLAMEGVLSKSVLRVMETLSGRGKQLL